MKMFPEDMKKYPKCTALITTLEGTLKGKPKVLNAFLQACTADDQFQPLSVAEKIAREKALRWAAGPRVDVHEGLIKATEGGQVVDACGFQPPYGSAQLILITSIWFDAFEFGSGADRDNNANRLTRTLLHELVHWVRQEARASDEILVGGAYKGHYQEAGSLFEEWAFGTRSICTPDQISDAIMSIRT